MEAKNYLICKKCKTYIPIHHPTAIKWTAGHEKCREGVRLDRVINPLGEEQDVMVLSWASPPTAIVRVTTPPEGYTSKIGDMEELAFSTAPSTPSLT